MLGPARIGAREVKNRLIMTGMSAHMAPDEGWVTDREVAFYERRARGGVGCIVVGAAFVHPSGTFGAQLGIHRDEMIPGLARLAGVIRRHGALASIQLHHAGRQTSSKVTGQALIAPSAVSCPFKQEMPRAMSEMDIEQVLDWYEQGARRAMEAGFDGVEVHGAHGYLPAQFLSPRSNWRTDRFGGSLANRTRFISELVRRVRRVVGEDAPVSVKISGDEYETGGLTLAETPQIGASLEAAGADLITVSAGVAPYYFTVPNMTLPPACYAPAARAVKSACSIPVSAVGRITTPELAESLLRQGDADFISMGRGLISDPDFPIKAQSGQADQICVCISCNKGCHDPSRSERATACLLNAEAGYERHLRMPVPACAQRVLVIGGGPGGLEAARVAALRGHEVVLCERESYWGGRLHLGTVPPHKAEYQVGIDYLVEQCRRNCVDMRLGQDVDLDAVLALSPDAVVLATGAEPEVPPLPGIAGGGAGDGRVPNVVLADDILRQPGQVLGSRVLLPGGGAVGSEVAHLLAERGHQVTVVEMGPMWGQGMPPDAQWHIAQAFASLAVEVDLHTRLTGVTDGKVSAERGGQQILYSEVDTVVVAAGAKPAVDLLHGLQSKVPAVWVVGDARSPRSALEAVAEGSRAGREIGG